MGTKEEQGKENPSQPFPNYSSCVIILNVYIVDVYKEYVHIQGYFKAIRISCLNSEKAHSKYNGFPFWMEMQRKGR